MKKNEFEKTLYELQKTSRTSLTMVILGALLLISSLIYSATRLTPLEDEITEKETQIHGMEKEIVLKTEKLQSLARTENEFRAKIASARKEFDFLKANIEQLYAVQVTSTNRVFELRATAKATNRVTSQGPGYNFSIFVNTSNETLGTIKRVTYKFDHPTFQNPVQSSSDAADRFAVGYFGWGCLATVGIMVELKTTEKYIFDFNMCKSLGPQWGNVPNKPQKG